MFSDVFSLRLSNRLEAYWSWDFEHGVAHLAHSNCSCRDWPLRKSLWSLGSTQEFWPRQQWLAPHLGRWHCRWKSLHWTHIEHAWNTHGTSLTSMETRSPFVYDSIDSWLVCTGHLGIQSLSWISGSQFFITLGSGALAHVSSHCSHVNRPWLLRPQPSLDGKHAIFGRVCRGMKATAYLEDLSIWRIIPKFYCRCGSIVSYCFWCLCFRARWFRNWAQLLPMHRRFPQKFRIFNRFSDTFLFRPVWRCLIMSYIMSYQLMVQDKPIQEAGRSQARSVFFWSRSSDKLCVQVKILRASTALAADANLGLWPDDQMIPPGEQKVSKVMSEVSKSVKMCHLPWWFLV